MANCTEHKNPLQNTGTSQSQRLLDGLNKSKFALVDEKNFTDWIVFANAFAAFINYYHFSNTVTGNWQPFFSSDVSAQLGNVAVQNIDRYRIEINERFDYIKDDDNSASLSAIERKLNELFSALLTLSKALDECIKRMPDGLTLKQTIQNLVKTKLAPALNRLLAYYKAAESNGYLNHIALSGWVILNKQLTDAQQIINTDGLSNSWFDESLTADWNTYTSSITPDDSIFNNPLTGFAEEFLSIEHAANHNLFTGIFDTYLSSYTKIINDAEAELLTTLEDYDSHAPHYALFLSFLHLFRFDQAHINTITQRHLDFYYKEVLRLQPRSAEANKVHVLGELAKQVDSYLLAQGIGLKAGKDSLKKEVTYSLDNDTVFNKAKVSQLKTFYKASNDDSILDEEGTTTIQDNTGRVFAAPVTNSDDGNGAALTSTNKEWQPYVHKVYNESKLESIAMPEAQLGFAIASHYLYLTEGERKVFVRFVTDNDTLLDGLSIECYLTAEKEWYKITDPVFSTGKILTDDATIKCAEISFTIPGSDAAIVNYNAAVHGGSYDVSLPMLKVYLLDNSTGVYEYDSLKEMIIYKIEVEVKVGIDTEEESGERVFNQKGLKNLLISNDAGTLDASKAFMPFGSQPKKDASFIIGHKEIFSKKNASVSLNIEWAELPSNEDFIKYDRNNDSPNTPSVTPQMLSGGRWISHSDVNSEESSIANSIALFNQLDQTASLVQLFSSGQPIPDSIITGYADEYSQLSASSVNGFMKLSLRSSFGFSKYIRDLSLYLIEKSTGTPSFSEPVEPYTPKIKSLYASYSAYSTTDMTVADETSFNSREINFFHIYPFGEGEQHKYLTPAENIYLLPQFKHVHESETKQHIGEFYIGIEDLDPEESVNILFQAMEGTTDPTVVKPVEHLHWSYLSNNQWIDFGTSDISDSTLQLVQSGIISIAIPGDATTENTILPSGYIWLRISVSEAAEAVCELISVDAQAAVATFVDNDNADDFLDSALAAGTISKLKVPDASVKKINQPYSSFAGRPKENEDHFYIRVSERLRHKARAITVWDYEHLVLEKFPEIYKVKCLNHTQIEDGVYNEVKPGYVSIITIPSLQNRNDANPLKPYTQQSTLTSIESYLQNLISCFVKLRACQPQFEEVRIEFSLQLHEQYKDFTFYANQLKDEITEFLSPWASGDNSTIDFGGKIYKSVLINFIEERYYVDFITDVFLYVKVDETTDESGDMDEITASTARSILVSAPASTHTIHPVDMDEIEIPGECGS
ncbi:MAG TPA: hypothetical protein VK483_09195 [Chitinophagaceae bacterium]|nr:hypothetical protein [Chitinophagaceae bacterium]